MKEHTNPKRSDSAYRRRHSLILRKNYKNHAQAAAKDRVGKFSSETTNTVAHTVLFKVPQTEVVFSARPTYEVRIGIGLTKSALYCTTSVINTGAGANIITEA